LIIHSDVVYNIKRIVNNKKRIKIIQFPLANMLGGGGKNRKKEKGGKG